MASVDSLHSRTFSDAQQGTMQALRAGILALTQ
jgi:hypothetical protein